MNGFTHREVPRLGRRLFRLGLSGSFGLDEAGGREALERIQFVGENSIDHTPKDEKVWWMLGDAFDVVGDRKQTDRIRY